MNSAPPFNVGLLWLLAAFLLSGCDSKEEQTEEGSSAPKATAETPQQGLEAIIAFYQAGDFDSLIRTRYAEISKAENDEQIQELVSKYSTRFADPVMIEEAVSIYRAALATEPEFSADGNTASFPLDNSSLKLTRMSNGKWGFHM